MTGILCCGVSFRTAGLEARERFAIRPCDLDDALRELATRRGVREAVILSTCNRVEIYAAVGPGGEAEVEAFLGGRSVSGPVPEGAIYRRGMPESVGHLFRVASGMDSMVFGETEILGQVKDAYRRAFEAGCTGPWLNRLFQCALRAAKQVRTHTGITRGAVSVGSVAVDLAGKIFTDLARCKIMIVGAGKMSERTARSLLSRGARTVLVSNRSLARATELARELGGRAIDFDRWEAEFADLDILISSTSAPHYILTEEKLARLIEGRPHRPLFLIDIAVPRDIDPSVNRLEGVYLYDIDSLRGIAEEGLAERRRERDTCERIVREHAAEFHRWMLGRTGSDPGRCRPPESATPHTPATPDLG